MSLIAFVSGRSPGLTTAVHALALCWPEGRQALIVEHDPAGGSLAARHEVPAEPGLTSLAAAGRRGLSADVVLQHCRRLPDGTWVLPAPASPELTGSALAVLSGGLAGALSAIPDTDVLADCGRIDASSPSRELIGSSHAVVLVVTPTVEGVAHAQARLSALLTIPEVPGRLGVLTIGRRPYGPDEVGDALGVVPLGMLADDRRGAIDLGLGRGRGRRRSELLRSADVVAGKLTGLLGSGGGRASDVEVGPQGPFPHAIEHSAAPWR
jgi:hypothetical protein